MVLSNLEAEMDESQLPSLYLIIIIGLFTYILFKD